MLLVLFTPRLWRLKWYAVPNLLGHGITLTTLQAQWDAEIAAGEMQSSKYPELHYTACDNGFAAAIPGDKNNTFKCNNVNITTLYTTPIGH